MNRIYGMIFLLTAAGLTAHSQSKSERPNQNVRLTQKVTFSKADQQRIQEVLGKDYTAVLGPNGQLAVVAPQKVRDIKATPRGGFTGNVGNAANAVFAAYEKAWVYKQSSGDVLRNKLGDERFKQLQAIMAAKGVPMQ